MQDPRDSQAPSCRFLSENCTVCTDTCLQRHQSVTSCGSMASLSQKKMHRLRNSQELLTYVWLLAGSTAFCSAERASSRVCLWHVCRLEVPVVWGPCSTLALELSVPCCCPARGDRRANSLRGADPDTLRSKQVNLLVIELGQQLNSSSSNAQIQS